MDKTIITASLAETQKLGEELAHNLNHNFIALYGELGAGKTSFTQGLAKGLGIKERITSPTFILIRKHSAEKKNLYHADLYRVEDDKDIEEQLSEILRDNNNIVVLEWAEKLRNPPGKRLDVWFRHLSENQREIKFKNYE